MNIKGLFLRKNRFYGTSIRPWVGVTAFVLVVALVSCAVFVFAIRAETRGCERAWRGHDTYVDVNGEGCMVDLNDDGVYVPASHIRIDQ